MISICKLLLIRKLMNHATICVIKNHLDIPFPNTIKACKIFQPIFLVAIAYIKDSGSLTKQKSKQKQIKDAPSLCDKVN